MVFFFFFICSIIFLARSLTFPVKSRSKASRGGGSEESAGKMLEKIGLPAKPSLRGNTWVVDASHCQGCSSQFTFINRKVLFLLHQLILVCCYRDLFFSSPLLDLILNPFIGKLHLNDRFLVLDLVN